MSFNYNNLDTPTKSYLCHEKLEATQLDNSLYNPLVNVIEKLNTIGNYIKNNEDNWNSEGLSEGGDTLKFPLTAINEIGNISENNKILYYNNDGNWEYKDYKELKFPLSELYDFLTSDNLDGTKWVLVYDLESSNDRGWKFLPYNTGTGSGLTLGKVAYDLNTVNNPNTNVKQILVWDNDGNGTWKWLIENYTSASPTTGLTWTDLTNSGSNKIDKSHLPVSTWWGRSINNDKVEGDLEGNIQHIRFNYNGNTIYLGLDSDGNLRVSKSENGNDGSNGANFYATGGVSALGNSSSSGGGGTPGETSLKSLLNNVNDLGTNYANPSTGYTIVYDNGSWVDRKLNLSELGNVSVNGVSNNDVLTYNGTNWVNSPALSVVSSLGLLSDVDDNVSVKLSSSFGTTYPNTILVGEPNNTGIEWKLYVYRITSETASSHGTQDGGIITALMFGSGNGNVLNYRFPTYITGVTPQSDTSAKYYLTGSKNIKNLGNWTTDYAETFCSLNVYIQNGELYSGGNFKVLTTNSTLSSSKLDNNSITVNGETIALGGSNNNVYWPTGKSFVINEHNGMTASKLASNPQSWTDMYVSWGSGNKDYYATDGSKNINIWLKEYLPNTITGGTTAIKEYNSSTQQYIGVTRNIWGQTYINNGVFQNVQGDLIIEQDTTTNNESIKLSPNTNVENPKIYMLGRNVFEYERNKNGVSIDTLAIGFGAEGNNLTHTNIIGKNIELTSTVGNVYIPNANTAAKGLRIGDAILYWDNSNNNNSLALIKSDGTACNFYATGGVSALGLSPGSGSGSVPAMTFGNLTVNNQLKMGEDVTLLNNGNWLLINGVEGVEIDNELQISGNITCSGVTLDDDVTLLYEDPDLILRIGNTSYKITKTVIQS